MIKKSRRTFVRLFCYSVSERGLFSMFKNNKKKIMLYLEGKNVNFFAFR